MKSMVVALLVALSATSSLTAASDTLRILSYRKIDMCSGERSWLISFSIGEVFASDSLQSFDITVGFDTSKITPTDLLISGTLADQMRFGDLSPFMTTVVPGELRVGGFTVTRNVRGDLPLVAVSGSYKGGCGDVDTFSLAYNPNSGFNAEFKGEITTFMSDSIVAISVPREDESQGPSFNEDTLLIKGKDSIGLSTVIIHQTDMLGSSMIDSINIIDDELFEIDSIWADEIDSVHVSASGQTAQVFHSESSQNTITYTVRFRALTDERDTATSVRIKTAVTSTCGCVTPTRTGELYLRSQHTTTSIVQRDVHESTDLLITQFSEALELQCSHGQPWKVMVVDLMGRQMALTTVYPGITSRLALSPLPTGTYIVYASNGSRAKGMTIAK